MPTIEDFFIKEYERVVAENNELKKQLSSLENSGERLGVFDLHQSKELVCVDIESISTPGRIPSRIQTRSRLSAKRSASRGITDHE